MVVLNDNTFRLFIFDLYLEIKFTPFLCIHGVGVLVMRSGWIVSWIYHGIYIWEIL